MLNLLKSLVSESLMSRDEMTYFLFTASGKTHLVSTYVLSEREQPVSKPDQGSRVRETDNALQKLRHFQENA